jgi:hypothetical protein
VSKPPTDERLVRLAALLREEGVPFTDLRSAGHEREIAIIDADLVQAPRLSVIAPAIKALGFRYVTLDLAQEGMGDG